MRNTHRLSISTMALLIGMGASPVLAQTVDHNTATVNTPSATSSKTGYDSDDLDTRTMDRLVDRDIGQENTIQQGVDNGSLTVSEASRLQRGEGRIDQMQSDALNNGGLSIQEANRLREAQAAENAKIGQFENNSLRGSPSVADAAFKNDLQRDINQQRRIDRGFDRGNLTPTEVSSLEAGQSANNLAQSRAGGNGTLTAYEQQNIRADERTQSGDIFADKHNDTSTGMAGGMYGDRDHDRNDMNRGDNDRYNFRRVNDNDPNDYRRAGDNGYRNVNRTGNDRDGFRWRNGNNSDTHNGDRDHDNFAWNGSNGSNGSASGKDKGWGHWSWDQPHRRAGSGDRDDHPVIGSNSGSATSAGTDATASAKVNNKTSVTVPASGSTRITGGATTPVSRTTVGMASTAGSSTHVTHVATPHVTPHITPHIAPHITPHVVPHIVMAHHK